MSRWVVGIVLTVAIGCGSDDVAPPLDVETPPPPGAIAGAMPAMAEAPSMSELSAGRWILVSDHEGAPAVEHRCASEPPSVTVTASSVVVGDGSGATSFGIVSDSAVGSARTLITGTAEANEPLSATKEGAGVRFIGRGADGLYVNEGSGHGLPEWEECCAVTDGGPGERLGWVKKGEACPAR